MPSSTMPRTMPLPVASKAQAPARLESRRVPLAVEAAAGGEVRVVGHVRDGAAVDAPVEERAGDTGIERREMPRSDGGRGRFRLEDPGVQLRDEGAAELQSVIAGHGGGVAAGSENQDELRRRHRERRGGPFEGSLESRSAVPALTQEQGAVDADGIRRGEELRNRDAQAGGLGLGQGGAVRRPGRDANGGRQRRTGRHDPGVTWSTAE